MIRIPLSTHDSFSQVAVRFCISPLFELAASLSIVAQQAAPQRFLPWVEEMRTLFVRHRLQADWEYFRPLFHSGIPELFDPLQTADVSSTDDVYRYLLLLPAQPFADSLQAALASLPKQPVSPAITQDVSEDPGYVKGRLLLFLSAYREFGFDHTWSAAIHPTLLAQAEKIREALREPTAFLSYLQPLSPALSYDEHTGELVWNAPGPVRTARELLICPSYYYASPAHLAKKGTRARLLFGI
ncbi:hypothetical protein ACAF76_009385 [Brevibacillus sp. TJ4]|uniref:hypothetical protein n=1 Tax=Brevibacillus sp. TJ4 TaxID=3234853 RepID=UPI0037D3DFA9